MQEYRSIFRSICAWAMLGLVLSTYAAGQTPMSTPTPIPAKPPAAPAPAGAPQRHIKVDCSATLYAVTFCDQLQQLMNAAPSDALSPDGTLNIAPTAVNGTTDMLLQPTSTGLWVQALAPSSAVHSTAKAYAGALLAWEAARLDKQKGSAQSSSASTDVVAKPGASGLLSLAAETGAFASTSNGSSLTLNGNVWNAAHLITNGTLYEESLCSSNCVNPLRTTNVIATFTVDNSNTTTAATTGAANSGSANVGTVLLPTSNARLSSITSRWNFWHSLDPASAKFQTAWNQAKNAQMDALTNAGNNLGKAIGTLTLNAKINSDPAFQNLQNEIAAQLAKDYASQNAKQMVLDYESFLERFFAQCRSNDSKDFDALVIAASTSLATFQQLNQQVIEAARGTPILTAEYTFSRPANQLSTHDLRFVAAESWKSGAQISANLAASIYADVPSGAAYGRVKDVQLSAEFDQAIGNKSAPPLVLSLAGYGQHQWDPSVLNITSANLAPGTNILLPPNAQQFLGTSGWLGIVQAKATIQLQKAISIPLAIKWSNKTDLLNAQDVRGQFGISYDFSSLITYLKGQ